MDMSEAFTDKPPGCNAVLLSEPLSPHASEQLAGAPGTGQSSPDVQPNCSSTMHHNMDFYNTEIQPNDTKHDRHHQAAPTSLTQLRDIAHETGDILSRLQGWQRISLRPQPRTSFPNTGRPAFINISRSAYTRLNFNSSEAQTLLKNISMIGKALDNVNVQLAPRKTPAELLRGLKRSSFDSSCSASSSFVPATSEVSSSAAVPEEHQTVQENASSASSVIDGSFAPHLSADDALATSYKDVHEPAVPLATEINTRQETTSSSLSVTHDLTNTTTTPEHVEYADLRSGSGSVFADVLKCLGFNFGLPTAGTTSSISSSRLPLPQLESDSFNPYPVVNRRSYGTTSSHVESTPDKASGVLRTDGEAESPEVMLSSRRATDTNNVSLSRQNSNTSSLSPVDASGLTECRTQAFESMSLQAHRHMELGTAAEKSGREYHLSQCKNLLESTQNSTKLDSSRRGRYSRSSLESQSSFGKRERSRSLSSLSSSSSNSGKKVAERERDSGGQKHSKLSPVCVRAESKSFRKTQFSRSRSSSFSPLNSVPFSPITKPLVLEKYSPKAERPLKQLKLSKKPKKPKKPRKPSLRPSRSQRRRLAKIRTAELARSSTSSLQSIQLSPITKPFVLEKYSPKADKAVKRSRNAHLSRSNSKSQSPQRSRSARSRSAHNSNRSPHIVECRESPKRDRSVTHSRSSRGSVGSRRSSSSHERSRRSVSSSRSPTPRSHGRASPRDRSRSRSPLHRPITSMKYPPNVPAVASVALRGPPLYMTNGNPCVIYPPSVMLPHLPVVYPMYASSSSRMPGFGCDAPIGNGSLERSQWGRLTDEFLLRSWSTEKADNRSDWDRSTEEFLNKLSRPAHPKQAHDP